MNLWIYYFSFQTHFFIYLIGLIYLIDLIPAI